LGSPTFSTRIISVPSGLEISPAVVANKHIKTQDKEEHVKRRARATAGEGD